MGLNGSAPEACLPACADFSNPFDEGVQGSLAGALAGTSLEACLPAAADSNNPFGDGEVLSPSSASSRQGPAAHSPRPLRRSLAESKPKKLDSSTPPTGRRPLFRVSLYPCLSWQTCCWVGAGKEYCVVGAVKESAHGRS